MKTFFRKQTISGSTRWGAASLLSDEGDIYLSAPAHAATSIHKRTRIYLMDSGVKIVCNYHPYPPPEHTREHHSPNSPLHGLELVAALQRCGRPLRFAAAARQPRRPNICGQ